MFRVTSTADILKSASTVEFMPENVLQGSEFTSEATKYTASTTKRYLVSFGVCDYSIATIIKSWINKIFAQLIGKWSDKYEMSSIIFITGNLR